MKKIILLFYLLLFQGAVFGNMAQPYSEGDPSSSLFAIKNCSVEKEWINIKLQKNSQNEDGHFYYADYKIIYHINSPEDKTIPLVFIGLHLIDANKILVNDKPAIRKILNPENESFLTENLYNYSVKFNNDSKINANEKDLIYFEALLKKGLNSIEVNYDASISINNFGFLKNYHLEYSLEPSRNWKSFGEINVKLEIPNQLEVANSNLGKYQKDGNFYLWRINNKFDNLKIEIKRETHFFQDLVLFISPLGFAVISAIICFIIHLKMIKNRRLKYPKKYNWTLPLGLILSCIVFYSVFFISFDFTDWVLQQKTSKHGYVSLFVFTFPIYLLIHGIVVWIIDYNRKKKIVQP